MKYTVIGGQGFIGSNIVSLLEKHGHEVWVPEKSSQDVFNKPLGIVIYAAGHGDCKNNPLKVFHSNLGYLVDVIEKGSFDKFIYISSTRVYMNQESSEENSDVTVCHDDSRALFNLTKLTAEKLVLSTLDNAIVVRPSNVYGLTLNSPLFLPSIVRDAVNNGLVNMYVPPEYAKDYVSVDDAAEVIYQLSKCSDCFGETINIASGENVTALSIANALQKNTACKINWHSSTANENFPESDITQLKQMLNYNPRNVLKDIGAMIVEYKSLCD